MECDPGEICWTSFSQNGFTRGCANRQCIPSVYDDNSTKIAVSNVCCTRELCNHSYSIFEKKSKIILLVLVLYFILLLQTEKNIYNKIDLELKKKK